MTLKPITQKKKNYSPAILIIMGLGIIFIVLLFSFRKSQAEENEKIHNEEVNDALEKAFEDYKVEIIENIEKMILNGSIICDEVYCFNPNDKSSNFTIENFEELKGDWGGG